MALSQVARTIQVFKLLISQERVTAAQLADQLNCSKRTVFRDIAMLRDAGIAVQADSAGHVIELDRPANAAELSDRELVSIIVAAQSSSLNRIEPIRKLIEAATSRILAAACPQVRSRVTTLLNVDAIQLISNQGKVQRGSSPDATDDPNVLRELLSVMAMGGDVRIDQGQQRLSGPTPIPEVEIESTPSGNLVDLDADEVHRDLKRILNAYRKN